VIDFVHCGVEYHAPFTKHSLSSTLEKSLAVTTTWDALECVDLTCLNESMAFLKNWIGALLFLRNKIIAISLSCKIRHEELRSLKREYVFP
jgi:hypothetical protein